MTPNMRTYRIDSEVLFGWLCVNTEYHRFTMCEMIQRYGILGKKVLAVGPGDCEQEYWFHELGNSLFLVDIDENQSLECHLQPRAEASKGKQPVTYVVGDARYVADWLKDKFDVIFTSGFTPDEAYRADILKKFGDVTRADPALTVVGTWPPDAGPLSQLCVDVATRGLAENGLFIMLSYASGPDVIRSRNYIPALKTQLEQHGLHLLEVHCLAQSAGCHLVVAMKSGDPAAVAARIASLQALPPLREFHARGEYDRATLRVFPGPLQLGDVTPDTVAKRMLGKQVARLEKAVGSVLDRYAPNARTAYYAGAGQETDGMYLLTRGIGVEFGWNASVTPPVAALAKGLLHPSLSATPQDDTRVDVCFLSFLDADEKQRIAAGSSADRSKAKLFAPGTLAFASAKLKPDGILISQGRSGGPDLAYDKTYVTQLQAELGAAGFALKSVYALKQSTGIFMLAAERRARADEGKSGDGISFYSDAQIDNAAVQLWPPAGKTADARAPAAATAASGQTATTPVKPANKTFLLKPEAMTKALALGDLVAQSMPAMRELIARFDLKGATLMSVGAGGANEELAMLACGVRRAFLFDIDEHNSLAHYLPVIHDPADTAAQIVYYLQDFADAKKRADKVDPVTLLYFSSYTPDEMRRSQIGTAHNSKQRWLKGDPNWPDNTAPLHDSVVSAIDLYLEDGGTFVLQSYYGGVDVVSNPGYVEQWRNQLARHGVALVEAYCLKGAPAVTLWIGVKGPAKDRSTVNALAAAARAKLAKRPALTQFHGRVQLADKVIARFFPAAKA